MAAIIPAIIPTSYADLEEKLDRLSGIAEEVQIDLVDGRYARPASWPYAGDLAEPSRMLAEGKMLPHCGEFRFEIDLMSADPESIAGTLIGLCATRITVHAESTRFLPRFLENAKTLYGHDEEFSSDLLSFGLALGAGTDIAIVEPYLKYVGYVQFMGIRDIGKQGQAFDPGVLPKISAFRKRYPGVPVQVDGGVSLATAPALLKAGVSRLVVGSALWKAPDLREAYRALTALTEEYGIYE